MTAIRRMTKIGIGGRAYDINLFAGKETTADCQTVYNFLINTIWPLLQSMDSNITEVLEDTGASLPALISLVGGRHRMDKLYKKVENIEKIIGPLYSAIRDNERKLLRGQKK